MIDIKLIRENPEFVRQALEKRGDSFPLDEILEVDARYLKLLQHVEQLRARHNKVSKQLGKPGDKSAELIAEMRKLGEKKAA